MSSTLNLGQFEVLSLFKAKVLLFLDSLIEMFPEESDLIVFRILFDNNIPIEESMRKFCSRMLPVKEMVSQRNDKFFLENNVFFSGLKDDKVIHWKNLWQSKRLDKQDREEIWKWMDLFVRLCLLFNENDKKLSTLFMDKSGVKNPSS